jgi:glutathione S-transferase
MMHLYRNAISGHCHRVELLLSILGVAYEPVEIDLRAGAHKRPEFLALNPFGQIPVLKDGDVVLADSNAILVYLARRYDTSGLWLPSDPVGAARVQRWLSVAAGPLASGPAAARRICLFSTPQDLATAQNIATGLLRVIDSALASDPYLVGGAPTIADLALYAYVARAPEGGVELAAYASVNAWLRRVERLRGFTPMLESR